MSNNQITHEQLAQIAVTSAQTSQSWPEFFNTFKMLAMPYMNQTCADPKCMNRNPLSETYDGLVRLANVAQTLTISPEKYAEILAAEIVDEDVVQDNVIIILFDNLP